MKVAVILPAAGLGTRMGKGSAEKAGTSRKESVQNALDALTSGIDLVAVHDAVRPFIDLETIHKVFDEAAEFGAAIVAVPAIDTVKQVTRGTEHVRVRSTIPREKLVM